MNFARHQFIWLAAAAVAVAPVTLSGNRAWSQARTIKIVVAAAPGAGPDILARLLGEQIGRAQGLTVVIENRPGAGGIIGTEAVARAAPDGNTVLIDAPGFLIHPHVRKVNYDPLSGFEPICNLVDAPTVIVVNSASGYRTLADLVNAAHAKPGDLTLASAGPATDLHIAFEIFKRAAKVDMIFVPYPGVAPAVNQLLGEHVTSVLAAYSSVAEQLNTGKHGAATTPPKVTSRT